MNIMSQRTANVPTRRGIALPAFRLPVYVRLMLMVMIVMAALVAVWTVSLGKDVPASNPFSDYIETLSGHEWNASVPRGFSCDPGRSASQAYCFRVLTSGPFSLVSVSLSNGAVRHIDFSIDEGALKVGDLALLWGRPNVSLYRESVILEWPRIGVSANGLAESRHFSFSIPVQRVSFDVTS